MGKEEHVGNLGDCGRVVEFEFQGRVFVKLGRAETFVNFGCRWTMIDYCTIRCKGVKTIQLDNLRIK